MQEKEVRLLYRTDKLRELIIQPSAINNGWIMNVISNKGTEYTLISKRATTPRIFKTLDACLNCCRRISLTNLKITVIQGGSGKVPA